LQLWMTADNPDAMAPLNKVKRNYPAYFIYKSQKLFF